MVAARRSDAPPSRAWAARAEFRRRDPGAGWVLAGVVIDHRFWPAEPCVEPVRHRLPASGLLGWTDLPSPVIAPTIERAADIALDVARLAWPRRVARTVPWAAAPARRG